MCEKGEPDVLGFLSVLDIQQIGYCGGLLILNSMGRPLEFHCTVPVMPTAAQIILYGATLKSHIFNEKIGFSLIQKSTNRPEIIVTDLPEMLELGNQVDLTICQVNPDSPDEPSEIQYVAEVIPQFEKLELTIEEQKLSILAHQKHCQDELIERLSPFAKRLPLIEPFDRIKNAITEAQSVAA